MKKIATILFISVFLILSLSVDTAENTDVIQNTNNSSVDINKNITNDSYILPKDVGWAKTDGKIYTDKSVKPSKPTITMTGKPSCTRCARNHSSYTWRTRTYLNYCFRCDSDFCVSCGKEKYSWSNVYLSKS